MEMPPFSGPSSTSPFSGFHGNQGHFVDTLRPYDTRGPEDLTHLGNWMTIPTPDGEISIDYVKLVSPITVAHPEEDPIPIPAGHFLLLTPGGPVVMGEETIEPFIARQEKRKKDIEAHPDAVLTRQITGGACARLHTWSGEIGWWVPIGEAPLPSSITISDAPEALICVGEAWKLDGQYEDPERGKTGDDDPLVALYTRMNTRVVDVSRSTHLDERITAFDLREENAEEQATGFRGGLGKNGGDGDDPHRS